MWSVMALAATLMTASPGGSGGIDGRVFDVSGNRLPDAEATLLSKGKPIATTTSDPDGHFVFDKLAAGDYVLRLYLRGFSQAERPMTVQSERRKAIDVWLKVGSDVARHMRNATVPCSSGDWLLVTPESKALVGLQLPRQPVTRQDIADVMKTIGAPYGAFTRSWLAVQVQDG